MNIWPKFVELKDFYAYMNKKSMELHINDNIEFTYWIVMNFKKQFT
jgi:hypothetical protein